MDVLVQNQTALDQPAIVDLAWAAVNSTSTAAYAWGRTGLPPLLSRTMHVCTHASAHLRAPNLRVCSLDCPNHAHDYSRCESARLISQCSRCSNCICFPRCMLPTPAYRHAHACVVRMDMCVHGYVHGASQVHSAGLFSSSCRAASPLPPPP